MSLRPATANDIPAIKSVIDATELFPSEYLDGMFTDNTSPNSGTSFWLIWQEADPIAVAYCAPEEMTDGTWNLLLIAVHPDRQSSGIGQSIMSAVETMVKAVGARILLVETSGTAEFERTRSFYEQLGYDREATIRDYYDAGDDKVVFRKAV